MQVVHCTINVFYIMFSYHFPKEVHLSRVINDFWALNFVQRTTHSDCKGFPGWQQLLEFVMSVSFHPLVHYAALCSLILLFNYHCSHCCGSLSQYFSISFRSEILNTSSTVVTSSFVPFPRSFMNYEQLSVRYESLWDNLSVMKTCSLLLSFVF